MPQKAENVPAITSNWAFDDSNDLPSTQYDAKVLTSSGGDVRVAVGGTSILGLTNQASDVPISRHNSLVCSAYPKAAQLWNLMKAMS